MKNYVIRQGKYIAVETLKSDMHPKRNRTNSFAKVPLGWAAAAAKATKTPRAMVWVLLQHVAWQTNSATFPALGRLDVDMHSRGSFLFFLAQTSRRSFLFF